MLSIIIPVYEPSKEDITICLDSIYNQNIRIDLFEVICVDDCSPTNNPYLLINNYLYQGVHPSNLRYFRHSENKRQGGARNTGVDNAYGKFIAYIDQDDTFNEGALEKLIEALRDNPTLDILMTTAATYENGKTTSLGYENKNSTEILTGSEFINRNEVPWCPWCYIYRRDFLKSIKLKFVENVRFEDVDYVMNATLSAKKIKFMPIDLYRHHVSSEQTSFIGNDYNRINDLLLLADRVGIVSEKFADKDPNGSNVVKSQYIFSYNSYLKRYLWRLKYSEVKQLLSTTPPDLVTRY